MNEVKYDKTSVESILAFAKTLTGKSLSEAVVLAENIANNRNRGDLGSAVEKYFFEHVPESNHGPDFAEAGLELKTTGVIRKSDGSYKAKERLVLTMINYEFIVDEEWNTSSLLNKCQLMLILFYLFERDVPVFDRRFVLDPLLYKLPDEDISQIRRDWEFIQQKVRSGNAHKLSEGDTFYLGACRKGSGGEKEVLRRQRFSTEGAKSRAFSFKPSYVNKIIEGHVGDWNGLGIGAGLSFEDATRQRFRPFLGKTIDQISEQMDYFKKSPNQKGFARSLVVRILAKEGQSVPELVKAGIEIKTVRLNANGRARESMSFPGFKFLDLVNEEWEDSSFFEKIEHKFLFVIFRTDPDGVDRLEKVSYWNMPFDDRLEAKRVWEETKRLVAIDASNLPKTKDSNVAHVRPKARDGNDKLITPQGDFQVKQCFWLNSSYITKVVKIL
jgi:DNA mismatch repair protein MutH